MTHYHEPKVIIFDLDGTLTESKAALTPEMGTTLARLMAKIPVAIMSGGSYAQFQKQFFPFMPPNTDYKNLYLFPTSAAQCYVWKDGKWQFLYNNPFTPEEKTQILKALAEALQENGLGEPPPQLWGEQIEDRGSQITWSALGQQAPVEAKTVWDPDRKERQPVLESMHKKIPELSVRANAYSSIDITHHGITKAYGIRRFSEEIIHLPISDMLYVGDALFPGGNDEIVKETGIPTQQVTYAAETAEVIKKILSS